MTCFIATDLEGRPALAAIVALQALEELWLIAFVGVHVEVQILLSEEARATDPAVVRPQERFQGFIVTTGRKRREISNWLVVIVCNTPCNDSFISSFCTHFRFIYFLYFLRRKRLDGRPRFLSKNSSGCEFDEGSLFSESDWLIAASAVSPSVSTAGALFSPEELASSGTPASALTLGFLAILSASVTNQERRCVGLLCSDRRFSFYFVKTESQPLLL